MSGLVLLWRGGPKRMVPTSCEHWKIMAQVGGQYLQSVFDVFVGDHQKRHQHRAPLQFFALSRGPYFARLILSLEALMATRLRRPSGELVAWCTALAERGQVHK